MQKVKVVVTGSFRSGRTSLIRRWGEQSVSEFSATPTDGFVSPTVEVEGVTVSLLLKLHTGGRLLSSAYFQVKGLIVIYDITSLSSFSFAVAILEAIPPETWRTAIVMLIGNKIDLCERREVAFETGMKTAQDRGALFMEVSVKEKTHFMDMTRTFVGVLILKTFSLL